MTYDRKLNRSRIIGMRFLTAMEVIKMERDKTKMKLMGFGFKV